jgi:hypothetical protein
MNSFNELQAGTAGLMPQWDNDSVIQAYTKQDTAGLFLS